MTRAIVTPTLGKCAACRNLTACLPGPSEGVPRSEYVVPYGYRLGYAIEKRDRMWLICKPCLDKALTAEVARGNAA